MLERWIWVKRSGSSCAVARDRDDLQLGPDPGQHVPEAVRQVGLVVGDRRWAFQAGSNGMTRLVRIPSGVRGSISRYIG
jgi:hypothetical protein